MEIYHTFSLTFGDRAENNQGMQMIGNMTEQGLSSRDFEKVIKEFPEYVTIIDLVDFAPKIHREECKDMDAKVIVIAGGIDLMMGKSFADKMFMEQNSLVTDGKYDKKALMNGRVVNKRARHNSCFSDFSQSPDYENGKGTVIDFKDTKYLKLFRQMLPKYFGEKTKGLQAEMNYYYDVSRCGIGWHGDSERRIVVCARLGCDMNMCFQWYHQSKPVSRKIKFTLQHGDMYAMTEKAVGTDWKKRKIPTIRHSAGSSNYTLVKRK